MNISFWLGDKEFRLSVEERTENVILVSLGKRKYLASIEVLSSDEILLKIDGKVYDVIINSNSLYYSVYVNGKFFKIERKSALRILEGKVEKPRKQDIKTSMPGRVVKVFVQEGSKVKTGQPILVLEAMKMQNDIKSPQTGIITKINPKAGDSVETGSVLFSVE
ncbi:MAG: biotin/lipoyl-binding protein [Candidatus Aminicenantes bacterium]|nr:MAG: biotin/lipoyl-binding protein [Candidatus Aminicenantes bacterium]